MPANATTSVANSVDLSWFPTKYSFIIPFLTSSSFGFYCTNINFTNYYILFLNQPSSGLYDVFRVNESTAITHKFYTTIAEGIWYWKVLASNGLFTVNSSSWTFTVCHPGALGTPTLAPEPAHFFYCNCRTFLDSGLYIGSV